MEVLPSQSMLGGGPSEQLWLFGSGMAVCVLPLMGPVPASGMGWHRTSVDAVVFPG